MATAKQVAFKIGSRSAAPVAHTEGYQANVENAKGYFDLVVNLNQNGKAIRISDKHGEQRVHITVKEVPLLISALNHVLSQNVKTSVDSLKFVA